MRRELHDAFTEFFTAVDRRLEAGAKTYGDRSFARAPAELIRELQQEALDLAGWGFILWSRLRTLEAAAESLSRAPLVVVRQPGGDGQGAA